MNKDTALKFLLHLTIIIPLLTGGCSNFNSPPAPNNVILSPSSTFIIDNKSNVTSTPEVNLTASADSAQFQITMEVLGTQVAGIGITPTPTITITPLPTLPQEKAYHTVYDLFINNQNCMFPCWWGMTPGETNPTMAYSLLAPLRGISSSSYLFKDQGVVTIFYPVKDLEIPITISYYSNQGGEKIQLIDISTQVIRKLGDKSGINVYDSKEYQELFQKYTLKSILSGYGKPERIWLNAFVIPDGYPGNSESNLTLLYPHQGIFVRYSSETERRGGKIITCPTKSFIEIWLLSPKEKDTYQEVLSSLASDWEGKPSRIGIKDLSGTTNMTIEDFYHTYINDTEKCIETSESIWPSPLSTTAK